MIVRRTIRLRVRPAAAQEALFLDTRRQYAEAFGAVVDAGWGAKRINAVQLHKATYRDIRSRLSLPSQLVITARSKAVEAMRSAKALDGGKPSSKNPSIRFDARCWRMDWDSCTARLTIIGGRVELPFNIDSYSARFWGLRTTTADLVRIGKKWWLHVTTEVEIQDPVPNGRSVGVDRGIRRPAVTSDGLFLGRRRWKDVEDRMLALRRRLQAKGTKSAKRHVVRLGRRLARFRRDCDHVLSRRLVESVEPGDTLVFEDLTHILDRVRARGRKQRRRLHAWSFARLGSFVGYKAPLGGVLTAHENPRDTSRRCPPCNCIDKANRRDQSHFRCVACGFARNADLVASWNIRDLHEGLWSPVSRAPGHVNGPNVEGGIHLPSASPGL
jgi:IS605 OrfB family transposase